MATSGKKGKKNKGTPISLQSFLTNGDAPLVGVTQVAKKIRNIDGEDSDDGSNSLPLVYQLPTAPRANRLFDDDTIPHKPPFIAYITNLPFDASENDIRSFFGNIPIVSLRLPREDGDTGRVRGFGYVEFETRDDLIHYLSLPDPTIKGRRIRIDLSNENEQQNNRQRNRRGFEGFGGENRDSTNWRRDNQESGSNNDRGYNTRERRNNSDEVGAPGSWRMGNRPAPNDFSPRRDERKRSSDRNRDYGSRNHNNDRDTQDRDREEAPLERPKLNLKPRTLPLPEIVIKPEAEVVEESVEDEEKSDPPKPRPSGVTSEKVFGSAKPVDTAAREKEIEERLEEARRQEKLQLEKDKTEIDEKLSEVQLEKTDKENSNSTISWRRRDNLDTSSSFDDRKASPNRRQDDRRRDNRDNRDRQNRNRDRNDRMDNMRGGRQNRDVKVRDENKTKRDVRVERPLPKYQPQQSGPILQTSNKYSGLDDEASE